MFRPLSTSKAIHLLNSAKNQPSNKRNSKSNRNVQNKYKYNAEKLNLSEKTIPQLKEIYDQPFERYKDAIDENKRLQNKRFAVIQSINQIRKETSTIEESIQRQSTLTPIPKEKMLFTD
ncbi:hypothetical protein TVAG_059590 [Trichomonas vaginalis G3]|uniref:Uncharacterized protein n=1 Tax=Trichomonas vaginalis (strain ATCC PRA-98 / G3) TaxID=412133 RepID=A2FB11_TRIV3|nr:hypothetical protein TVAGG3_0710230 [Trichomonas vaginalis G3]EAX97894.1 hypothetical protein TVAG_059590 [Trichomonas vaginalis G3]KAI5509845.1 hypothetical protein TVAGG3_0710230 [Trichomonas vaginalis G3]|eukprot:XP_001310824.1 hypothetical protein [Trichomonas vaginalis G3]